MDILEKLLWDLTSAGADRNDQDCFSIYQNIESYVEHHVGDQEQIIFLIIKSQTPPSLFHFISENVKDQSKDMIKTKVGIFKFIASYLKKALFLVDSFAQFIIARSIEIFKREDSNEVKTSALLPIKVVLSLIHKQIIGYYQISLDVVITSLFVEFDQKKIPSSLRYNIFVVLGYLINLFRTHDIIISNVVDKVLLAGFQILFKNFDNTSTQSPDFPLIAGVLSCFDRCMVYFENNFTNAYTKSVESVGNDSKRNNYGSLYVMLWKCMLQVIRLVSNESLHRYAVINKALRFIKNHCKVFQDVIGLNIKPCFDSVTLCYYSTKSGVDKYAEDALWGVLYHFSEYIIGLPLDSSLPLTQRNEIKSLEYLMIRFKELILSSHSLITTQATNKKDVMKGLVLGLLGVIALSPATSLVMKCSKGSDEFMWASGIVQMLISCADAYSELNPDTNSMAILVTESQPVNSWRSPSILSTSALFLSAVSVSFAMGMSEDFVGGMMVFTNNSIYEYLLRSALPIITGYVTIQGDKYRIIIQRSLCLSLFSISLTGSVALVEYLKSVIPIILLRAMSRSDTKDYIEIVGIDPLTGDRDGKLNLAYSHLLLEIVIPKEEASSRVLHIIERSTKTRYYQNVSIPLLSTLFDECNDILNKFQLEYHIATNQNEENEGGDSNQAFGVPIAANVADQDMLLNLSSFVDYFLSVIHLRNDAFVDGIHPNRRSSDNNLDINSLVISLHHLLVNCCNLSTKYPLISALYRIIRIIANFLDNFGIFIVSINTIDSATDCMTINFIDVLTPYYEHIATLIATDFQNELLSTSLGLLLSGPSPLNLSVTTVLLPAIKKSLQSGLQIRLALNLLQSLIDRNIQLPVLDMLPLLEKYITKSNDDDVNKSIEIIDEVPIYVLAFRILGRLGQYNKNILVSRSDSLREMLKTSHFHQSLCIDIPVAVTGDNESNYNNTSLSINIGSCVIRIMDLCVDSRPEARQLRVLATEALHGNNHFR
jgi:hypothetical protein